MIAFLSTYNIYSPIQPTVDVHVTLTCFLYYYALPLHVSILLHPAPLTYTLSEITSEIWPATAQLPLSMDTRQNKLTEKD